MCNARCSEIWNECGEFLGVDDEKEFCSSSGFGEVFGISVLLVQKIGIDTVGSATYLLRRAFATYSVRGLSR